MLPIVAFLVIAAASAAAFAIGRTTAEREINRNHHRLAVFCVALRSRDDVLAIMSREDRNHLDELLHDYADAKTKALGS